MKTVEVRVDVFSLIPHTFLYVTDPGTGCHEDFGFAPQPSGLTGPGNIFDDTTHEFDGILYKTELTDQQYTNLMNEINASKNTPPSYDLPAGDQCTTWAVETLDSAGVPIPSLPPSGESFFKSLAWSPYYQIIEVFFKRGHEIIDEFHKHINELVDNFFRSADKYRPPVRYDPLTLDLDGDGLKTVGTSAGILFDQTGNGVKTGTGWVKPDDGFLVLDKNGNGVTDNGRELFGDSTIKSNGQLAADGFDALRDLDSNGNGKIDAGDAQFTNLRVWRDLNQDGTTQNSELFTLSQLNIASINTGSTTNNQTLPDGNQIADLGTFTRIDGSIGTTGNLGDINLAQDAFHRQFTTYPDTSAVASLPDMQGSGVVRDLREVANDYLWRRPA